MVRSCIAAGVRAHKARRTSIALAAFGLFVAGRNGGPTTATAGLIPSQYRRAARSLRGLHLGARSRTRPAPVQSQSWTT